MERARLQQQVDRLIASQALYGSESLCRLLQYLAKHTIENPGSPLKEYQIATELYGRPTEFDPQTDSMVRVRAGRLRVKLAKYYEAEGANDPLILDLPKGSYVLRYYPRTEPAVSTANGIHHAAQASNGASIVSKRFFLTTVIILFVLLASFLLSTIVLLARRKTGPNIPQSPPPVPQALSTFWNGIEKSHEPPWVIFSNAKFIGRPDLGLRYYDAKRDAKSVIFDHYTGVGEVLGVHALDTVFARLGRKVRVKRGSLFTLDEAKNNDLVFIGSPSENLSLLDIPVSHEFQFRSVPQGPRKGNMEILNSHAQPGEAAEFLASPSNVPLTEDYAVITFAVGLDYEHSVLILAGTTTFGTEAAVEFVSNEETMQILLSHLGVSSSSQLRPFEALIHVKITRGVPVETNLVAIRKTGS